MGPQVEQGECLSYGLVSEDREDEIGAARCMRRQELRLFLIVASLVVTLDQITKLWIRASLSPGDQIAVLPGFIDLVLVKNYGAAFGMLAGQTALIIGFSIAGLIAISAFLHHFPPTNTLGIVSFALILGGTSGNLVDRIRPPHYVTDFVRVHLLPTFSWPAFNVADAAMTVGIIALIIYFYRAGLFRKVYGRSHKSRDREASA
jgi:signal peptidase II